MSHEADESAFRLFRVRKTAHKMLRKRGYNVGDEDMEMTFDQFKARFGAVPAAESLKISVSHVSDPSDVVMVFILNLDKKVGAKEILEITRSAVQSNVHRIILATKMGVTSMGAKASQAGVHIELFKHEDLLVDITEHELVPEHHILSNEDKVALLKRYRLQESQLPRIQRTDPVARYFGVVKGQVLKIVRPSETAGRYVTYRIVE